MKIRVLLFWGFVFSIFGYGLNGRIGTIVGFGIGLAVAGLLSAFETVVVRDSDIEWRL